MPEDYGLCRCGAHATNWCPRYELYYCRKCGCPFKASDLAAHKPKHHHEPLDHIEGPMSQIGGNLFLGDRFDAEQLPLRADSKQWVVFAIIDYPQNEVPNEPADSRFFSIFGPMRDSTKFPYGSDWHDSPELMVDMKVMDAVADEIRDALHVGNKVLVHCVGGMHRSPLVIVYFLYREGYADTVEEAYDWVQKKRPIVERRIYWLPEEYHDKPRREDFE